MVKINCAGAATVFCQEPVVSRKGVDRHHFADAHIRGYLCGALLSQARKLENPAAYLSSKGAVFREPGPHHCGVSEVRLNDVGCDSRGSACGFFLLKVISQHLFNVIVQIPAAGASINLIFQ
jgi:hypothetical protein